MAEDITRALDRLQSTAENLIAFETNRRIQLGREKEARMVEAYQYLINNEETEIGKIEAVLDSISTNLETRGIERLGLGDEQKTLNFDVLLDAASEGASELANARLDYASNRRASLQKKKTRAMSIARHIDLLDDAISAVDPAYSGDKRIVDAEDVVKVGMEYIDAQDAMYKPEMLQALEFATTSVKLGEIETDYYARLKKRSEEQVVSAESEQIGAKITVETLEATKKETQEAVKGILQQENTLGKLADQFGIIISREGELLRGVDNTTGLDLEDKDREQKQIEIVASQQGLAAELIPWATNLEAALEGTPSTMGIKDLQAALTRAVGNPRAGIEPHYYDLIKYLKYGNAWYNNPDRTEDEKEGYYFAIFNMLGIDISNDEWIQNLFDLNSISPRVDIKQGNEMLRIAKSILPEVQEPVTIKDPTEIKYGL
ncbi:hypothetical protein CMI37_12770 [Candidatus Pacearchaeota archaeon]|nr:hypothetical protein [Candidatus Pacearchaeota archaeon]|tara:strand:- start:329 stop:1624 length:1296 start_codon:yes stop_codon:yes gene_type:complete